jgi:hypothetical protein
VLEGHRFPFLLTFSGTKVRLLAFSAENIRNHEQIFIVSLAHSGHLFTVSPPMYPLIRAQVANSDRKFTRSAK